MQPLSERHNSTKRDHANATFNNNLKGTKTRIPNDIMIKTFKVICL